MSDSTESYKTDYPLLMKGRDWRRRIPPKKEKETMTKKIYMTRDDWMDFYNINRKQYGNNVMDWPKHKRDYVKRITLVREVQVELRQLEIPYGNTGVTSRK